MKQPSFKDRVFFDYKIVQLLGTTFLQYIRDFGLELHHKLKSRDALRFLQGLRKDFHSAVESMSMCMSHTSDWIFFFSPHLKPIRGSIFSPDYWNLNHYSKMFIVDFRKKTIIFFNFGCTGKNSSVMKLQKINVIFLKYMKSLFCVLM